MVRRLRRARRSRKRAWHEQAWCEVPLQGTHQRRHATCQSRVNECFKLEDLCQLQHVQLQVAVTEAFQARHGIGADLHKAVCEHTTLGDHHAAPPPLHAPLGLGTWRPAALVLLAGTCVAT